MSHSTQVRRDLAASPALVPSLPATDAPATKQAPRSRLAGALPAAAVVALLAGLAAWGHYLDWSIPKFSDLLGTSATAPEDWCQEHNVAESQCIECNVALVPRGQDYGWCGEHGISQCPLHHPDVAQLKTPPRVTPEDFERARLALSKMPRGENNSHCRLYERRIQFASMGAVDKAGVDIALVQRRPLVEAVVANGEVIYDQARTAHLASRVGGSVWRVDKQVGDQVRKGDVLALVDAGEVGRAKSDFLQAIAQVRLKQVMLERMKPLAQDNLLPGRQFQEAEAALQEAKIKAGSTQQALVNLGLSVRAEDYADLSTEAMAERIRFLGIGKSIVDHLDGEATSNLFPLRSPLDGVVVEREIVAGEVVDTKTALFTVADVSRMWLLLDVRQEDARYLSLGQRVLFRPSERRNPPDSEGTIGWISTSADSQTRTVKVRVELPNGEGRLRANTFGTGRVVLRDEPGAMVVPSEAVHWDGCCNVVFVRDKQYLTPESPKFFHIRQVRTGVKEGSATEIIAGLLPGEVIASTNSVVLAAQLLRSNLGAGCCEACAAKK